ncbi:hypothetical protein [Streptomyces sp. NPDC046887]|uniref:hypothetical protein n=1 Tax=Streptomyces sp. NPDC046887 TaxID=3155472 RepID=UPI00340B1128
MSETPVGTFGYVPEDPEDGDETDELPADEPKTDTDPTAELLTGTARGSTSDDFPPDYWSGIPSHTHPDEGAPDGPAPPSDD